MSQTPQPLQKPTQPASSNISPVFAWVILGLMLLIIATLSALWYRERSARVAAQGDLAAMAAQYQKLQQTIGSFLGGAAVPPQASAKPVDRDDLTPQNVALDGKARSAYTISAKAGERIGFQSGDVIIISPAAASGPAVGPTGG